MSGYWFHTSLVPAMTVSSEDVQNADTAYVVYDMCSREIRLQNTTRNGTKYFLLQVETEHGNKDSYLCKNILIYNEFKSKCLQLTIIKPEDAENKKKTTYIIPNKFSGVDQKNILEHFFDRAANTKTNETPKFHPDRVQIIQKQTLYYAGFDDVPLRYKVGS